MALLASAVRVGVTGKVWYAPQGTTAPTATSTSLATGGWNEVGYATDDGLTVTVDTTTSDIRGWQNGDLLRRVQTAVSFSVNFKMAETNEQSLKLYFNNYAHGAAAVDGTVTLNGQQAYRGVFVIDVVDGTSLLRFVFPDGQVTDRGDISIVSGDAMTYDVTVTGFPDVAGNSGYLYVAADAAS